MVERSRGLRSVRRACVALHVYGDPSADLRTGSYAVHRFLHFAMPAKATLNCIGCRRQQRVIQKRHRFVQVRRDQLVERATDVFEATHAAAKSGQLVKSSIGSAAAVEQAIDLIHDVAQRAQVWQASGDSLERSLFAGRQVMFDEQVTVVE